MTLADFEEMKSLGHFGQARARKIMNEAELRDKPLPRMGYETCLHSCKIGKAWLANESGQYHVWVWWDVCAWPDTCKCADSSE